MRSLYALTAALFIGSLLGCPDTTPPPPRLDSGFFIQTSFFPIFPPVIVVAPGITTHWDYVEDFTGGDPPRGSTSSFDNTTNGAGVGVSENGRVPAIWHVTWKTAGPDPRCAGKNGNATADHPQRTVEVMCFETVGPPGSFSFAQGGTFVFEPSVLYTDNSAGSIATISGQGLTSQFGMPVLRYFDSAGTLINHASATAVAPDGTWIRGSIPDVSQLVPGSYVGAIYNLDSGGNLIFMGTTSLNVLDPIIPLDPGGCQGDPRPLNCN